MGVQFLKKICFNRMSYICEYVRKPFEKSEKVKIACWQPALAYSPNCYGAGA